MRKTLTWMLVLIVLGAAGAGGVAWKVWSQSNQLVREQIERAMAERVPDWDVAFGEAALDRRGTVRLTDVTLRARGRSAELLHVPALVVAIDRKLLAENQLLVVTRVRLEQPTVWLSRNEAGTWNWQELLPPPRSDAASPEIEIVRGTVVVRCDRSSRFPETRFACRSVTGRLLPSGHRRYVIRAETEVDYAGSLAVQGSVDLTTGAWQLTGDVAAIDTQQGLIGVAAGLSPELREKMTALSDRMGEVEELQALGPRDAYVAGPREPPVSFGSEARGAPATGGHSVITSAAGAPEFALPELGVEARLDVHFEISRKQTGAPLAYLVAADIRDGQIVNEALPVSLHDLRGRIRATNDEVEFDNLTATNADSSLRVSGKLVRMGDAWGKEFSVQAANLELDRKIRDYLHTPALLKIYDQISPAGRFNLDVRVAHDGASKWDVKLNEFTALRCAILHEAFQYPIHDISGRIRQEGETFHVELDGFGGDRPVALRGTLRRPGPEIELALRVTAQGVPLDRRVSEALQLPKYDAVRGALEMLRLAGLADVDAGLYRAAGAGSKLQLQLHVEVREGALDYVQFPYALTDLRGTIDYDPRVAAVWHFRNLSARHHAAVLAGQAAFDQTSPPGRLNLAVSVQQAALDRDLYTACCAANESLRTAWGQISPSGTMDIREATVDWTPGSKPVIALPAVQLSGGTLQLAALPDYRWSDVTGLVGWRENRVSVQSLSGYHGDSYLEINGTTAPDAAYVEIAPRQNVAWRVHLDDIRIRQLLCNAELRNALPERLSAAVESLNPRGPIDIDMGIDLKGAAHSPDLVNANWWLRAHLAGNDLQAGIDLQNVIGNIELSHGLWDGANVTADGYVECSSLTALDMPLEGVHGPFAIDGNQLTFGTPDWKTPDWRPWLRGPVTHSEWNRYPGRQIEVDKLYSDERHNGRLGLDGVVQLGDSPASTQYRAAVVVRDASLRAWARQQGVRATRLSGAVNGEMTFAGSAVSPRDIRGGGWVQVSEAELYELPVFAQFFALPNFKPITKTAFKYGYGEFTLHDGFFDFSAIRLDGDALDLAGKGSAEYANAGAGRVRLDLYSRADDQWLGRIPVLGSLLDNWLHVRVDGTIDNPVVLPQPGNPAKVAEGLWKDLERMTLPIVPMGMAPRPAAPPSQRPRL